jgi:hypothetical protein
MLQDETCFFLAADFDKKNWREDVGAVWETCRQLELPVAMERSRSGNGAHLWLFFDKALPAVLARKLGAYILTETMERRPEIGLDSYDRFFPNQDTLPNGGFGNLIALPLQKQPHVLLLTSFWSVLPCFDRQKPPTRTSEASFMSFITCSSRTMAATG